MNWYNKFIKISTRNELDIDSIKICQKLFSDFRLSQNSNALANKTLSYDFFDFLNEGELKKYNNAKVSINMSTEIYSGTSLAHDEFDIGGLTLDYGTIEQHVELSVKVTKNFKQNNYKDFYMLLFNIVRHELQHVYDNLRKKYDNKKINDTSSDLIERIARKSEEILSKKELESYIRGLMLRAKRERKSFVKITEEFVEISFYGKKKELIMKYPIYSQLKPIEDKTISKIVEEANKIFKKVV